MWNKKKRASNADAENKNRGKINTDKNGASKEKRTSTSAHAPVAPIPPDGGWGWVVTFCSFMLGFLVDGICFTFGVFFNDFQSYFNASKSTTSSINSVLNGTYLSLGPIVGALVNKFGCRKIAIIGTIISSASFFLSIFSPNAEVMIIIYGLCGGIGFGLMYLPSIVMVGYYFDKRRALATGIAVCGSGIGSFTFSPLFESLIQQFTWKGAMMIISGLVLNGVVFSAMFRPLEVVDTDVQCENEVDELDLMNHPTDKLTLKDSRLNHLNPIYRCRSVEHVKTNGHGQMSETARLGNSLYLDTPRKTDKPHHRHVLNPLVRKDIFYSGSIRNLPEFQKAGNEENFVRSMMSLNESESDSVPQGGGSGGFLQSIHDMFDLSLLKSPTFGLYGMSCFLCMIGFFVPFIYIPDIARGYGMDPSETAWIISTIGITNTLGRIAAGYVSDKPWADCIVINTVALVVGGVATLFVPFYRYYAVLVCYALLFGFCIAAFVSLRSIIIVELLGINKLTSSFGLVVLCQGLSTFIGSPIAGAISDLTGDYRASFYLAGTVIIISGLMCLPLRRLSRWEAQRAKKKEERNHGNVENAPMLRSNGVHQSVK